MRAHRDLFPRNQKNLRAVQRCCDRISCADHAARLLLHRIGQLVWSTLRAIQVRVSFGIAGEDLPLRIPTESAAELPGDVGQVAEGAGAVADLHVGNAPLAGLDAIDPILKMVVALVNADVRALDRLFRDGNGLGVEPAAMFDQRALVANKDRSKLRRLVYRLLLGLPSLDSPGKFRTLSRSSRLWAPTHFLRSS